MTEKQRWFYLILFWIVNFCLGSFYAWSIYSSWLADLYTQMAGQTVSVASLTYIFSIGAALNPVAMVLAGGLTDRFGPRLVLFIGGIVMALGYLLMSLSTGPMMLLLGFGVCLGLGSGASVIATVTSAVKLFPDKRGFAGGSVGAFYGIGSVCLPPLANYLAGNIGISSTLFIYSVACAVIILGSAFLIRLPASRSAQTSQKADNNNLVWYQMIRTGRFWAMFVLFIAGTLSPLMLFSQTVTVAQTQIGLSISVAVFTISALALANTIARFLGGAISDKLGRVFTLGSAVALAIFGLVLLSLAGIGDSLLFFAGLVCIGAGFGSFVGVFPGYTAEQFGPANASMNYGVLALAFSVSGILGPNIIALTVSDGHYRTAYFIAMIISAVGLAAAFVCRRLEVRQVPSNSVI